MFKYIYLFSLIFILCGCYYSFKDDCWYGPETNCIQRNKKSDLQRYYRADGQQISEEQKISDIRACGAVPDKNGSFLSDIWKNKGINAVKKVGECMTAKGYDYDNIVN